MTTIKIPKGDSCQDCVFCETPVYMSQYVCAIFKENITNFVKCQQCKNKEPIIIQYGEADENKTE